MSNNGADFNTVKLVDIGEDDFFTSTKGEVDISNVFEGWTCIEGKLRGEDVNFIATRDLDLSLIHI